MNTFTSVTIVVGATNEGAALKQTIDSILNSCCPDDIGIIRIVRSKNATPACVSACRALEQRYPKKVTTVIQTRPYIGGAIRDGFDGAETTHLLLLPGDLALELAAVPKLIKESKRHPDAVIKTSRWMRSGGFYGYSHLRQVINFAAQIFIRLLFRTRIKDLTNPVQIMPTALYNKIDWQELNFPFLVEMVLCPLRLGVEILEVPATCFGRKEGRSNNSVLQTALYLKTVLRIRFSKKTDLIKNE